MTVDATPLLILGRMSEAAAVDQLRALLRQPRMAGMWRAARAQGPELGEDEVRLTLERLDPLWDKLFPAERARIVRLLVKRVDVGPNGAEVRLRLEGLASH